MTGSVDQTGAGRGASSAEVRQRLLEIAAHMVREQGAPALSARKLAAAAGTSTMAVYTHFGGMPGLVRAMVAEGFRRLFERVAAVPVTDDPLQDLRNAAAAYRAHAQADPDLYMVMFGSATLGDHRLHREDRIVGLDAFEQIKQFMQRGMAAGALREADPAAVAAQWWTALHGFVMLELTKFIDVVDDAEDTVLWPLMDHLLRSLMVTPGPPEPGVFRQ
ncbi:TetR/AcrR family transcriptional regulator [Nocardioides glacieisoli]|uniref:TetR/AcrR family transcriptional regulator n=1 Tax=Nocardioides glacieisoli TaxID=1168730 RepID=A0A4Q2RNJ8_9ACTN|nr:TetR/AcrR family transcriptional regulator [Nocardioides glacieisoli]RYB90148.1 TetR/AcrR family transcriptional regulator [Nocardioides glacieisoli]